MSKRLGERILGPYADRDKWRVVEVSAGGERTSTVFDEESKAIRYVEIISAELEREDYSTETAILEYKAHLVVKGNKTDSIRQTCWWLRQFFPTAAPLKLLSAKRSTPRCERA